MMVRATEDRRRDPRVGLIRTLHLRPSGQRPKIRAHLVDLSEGGLRGIGRLESMGEGNKLTVEIPIGSILSVGPFKSISLPAMLVRLSEASSTGEQEFAIAFRPVSDSRARRLARFVKRVTRAQSKLAAIQGPSSAVADALRMVAVSLGRPDTQRARVALVSSATSGEGKSFIAAHLAGLLADEGFRVLLVDADVRRPSQHQIFGTPPSPGLADLLTAKDSTELAEVTQSTRAHVDLIAAGTDSVRADRHLHAMAEQLILQMGSSGYDYVVVDSPPLLVSATGSFLARHVDEVLLVARLAVTRSSDLQEAKILLTRENSPLLGIILNDDTEPRKAAKEYSLAAQPENEPESLGDLDLIRQD